ncbi:MAG TPA: M13 family metallopeptidase [Gemmatimonadaceae bacterium]
MVLPRSRWRVAACALALAAMPLHAPLHAQLPATGASRASRPLDPSTIDSTCAACQDFFQFASGAWVKRTEIPAAYTSYGSFTELSDRNQEVLHAVLDAAAAGKGSDLTTRKVGIFYATCMDSAAIERAGIAPLAPRIARIDAIRTVADLERAAAHLRLAGVDALVRVGAEPDFEHSARTILGVHQGGLGLPDRDYYLKPDSASARIRDAYVAHVGRMLQLLGEPADTASADARRVMAIETALASASMPRAAQRDPSAVYHPMTLDELQAMAPRLSWRLTLDAMGVRSVETVNVAQPAFVRALDSLVTAVPLDDWKAYLRWHLADAVAPSMGSAFVAEDFQMTQLLSGARELLPRWKRCLRAADRSMGEALGQAYVKRAFTPDAKARALAMVRNMEAVLRERLASLSWMSDSTRRQAALKLAAFENKIGYPDRWRDYSALTLEPRAFVLNQMAANEFEARRRLARVGKAVDRSEWGMTPPTVNAYYNPLINEIVFPAGILQPPFFDPNADDAVNYGGMGAVIGHEMTHGFDDQGRRFDAEGDLRDWWTPADAAEYTRRATLVERQFDGYVGVDTLHVNGKLTLGENIADLGGLTIAYAALERELARKGRPGLIDGFTPEQRFFLAWAQIWRRKVRPEAARQLLIVDPHSPARWRVNGPLSNMPEFQQAWGCKAGEPMVRPDSLRAQIW